MTAAQSLLLAACLLCTACSPAAAAAPLVSVDRQNKIEVSRGRRVDLRPALLFNLDSLPEDVDCKLVSIPNGSFCGRVLQDSFDCKNYTGPILYQHFGCFYQKDLATFLVSSSPAEHAAGEIQSVQAGILSVEVAVRPDKELATLRVDVNSDTTPHLLTIVFPPSAMTRYHYEVVTRSPVLSLPISGRLEGAINTPLPSGYVRKAPPTLTYWPEGTHPHTDYILLRLYHHNETLYSSYVILPLGEETSVTKAATLLRDTLTINQGIDTPISKSNFRSFNHTLSLATHTTSQPPLVYYHFPVKKAGTFCSLYSTSTNVSHTIFSSHELEAGHVAFYPTDPKDDMHFFTYLYKVTNVIGEVIARGEISVLVTKRVYEEAPQRVNLPLPVLEAGVAAINNLTLDFYAQQDCGSKATLRVLRPPAHGILEYENGTGIAEEKIPFWLMRNSTLVRYRHLGGEELGDVIYWGIQCPAGQQHTVFMSVLVVPEDDSHPTFRRPGENQFPALNVLAFADWATPLSPSSLPVLDPDSPTGDIRFTVEELEGHLLKPFHSTDKSRPLYPLLSLESLTSMLQSGEMYEVLDFTLTDLELQQIWYCPSEGLLEDSIFLTVGDSIRFSPILYSLRVTVSQQPPTQSLVISTPDEYPYLVRNRPLPLLEEGHMLLTSHFLYSQAPPSPSASVEYIVTSPPQHGRLCFVSHPHCQQSLSSFTQRDVNHHRIIYRPGAQLKPDHFEFVLTVEGVSHANASSHTFSWTLQQQLLLSDRNFWLNPGKMKRVSAKFFRRFTSELGTKNVAFHVVQQPQYGHLLLGNRSHFYASRPPSFTFADLMAQEVWYNHTQPAVPPLCSDNLLFEATSTQRTVQGKLPILFKTSKDPLSIIFHQHKLKGLSHFTFSTDDIEVSSPFCAEFVSFTVWDIPQEGQLTLKEDTHNTERQLMEGSKFTAKDIQQNALSYRLHLSEDMSGANLTDRFAVNASDPIDTWPPQNKQIKPQPEPFSIIIIPSADEEYLLEVSFSSDHPVTWLPDRESYGYLLTPSDIDLLNSTLQPDTIVVQVESGLTLGILAQGDTPITFFKVSSLQSGSVAYIKNSLIPKRVFRDEIEFGVYASLLNFRQQALSYHFALEWALVGWKKGEVTVSELQTEVQLTITRSGSTWFESRVIVATAAGSASSQDNCSWTVEDYPATPPDAGDFCRLREEVVFLAGESSRQVTLRLLADMVAEGEESFFVQLLEEEGLTNAILHGHVSTKVTITDVEDYNTVRMEGDPSTSNTPNCQLETSVDEFDGSVVIELTRTGALDQELGVTCYTQDYSATGNLDFLPRLANSQGSEVTFGVNQSVAECEVVILDDERIEHREAFYVLLSPLQTQGAGALVQVEPDYSTMCVYINHDINDYPVVAFNETEVFAKESETETRTVSFTLKRSGPNLNINTDVKYIHVPPKDEDTAAIENVDFQLYIANEHTAPCRLEGDPSPGGCVRFSPGQIYAVVVVNILNDTLAEGNETFYLKIPYARNGTRSADLSLSTLKVTIIDAAQPTYMELTQTSITLSETVILNKIKVRRRGSLQRTTSVQCVLKGVTATGGSSTDNITDFFVPQEPEMVTFEPDSNQTVCLIFLINDQRYEGVESLLLTLQLPEDEPGVKLTSDLHMATVYITDEEDLPVVQFSVAELETLEPLSNTALDSSPLQLEVVREGDSSRVSNISYHTADLSAQSGQDYEHVTGVLEFESGSTRKEVNVSILPNPQQTLNTTFEVRLSLPANHSSSDPTTLGDNSVITVTIRNLPYEGVYFPALPQVDNMEDGRRAGHAAGVYYDMPLMCITACDAAFHSDEDTLSDCEGQGIWNNLTVYSWEVSEDGGSHYSPVTHVSALTSPHQQVLLPVYLAPGLHVRCRAQAVDMWGVKGHARTSWPVEVKMGRYGCHEGGEGGGAELQAQLSSYDSFMAADQDLVLVELTVPAIANTVPFLSLSAPAGQAPDNSSVTDPCSSASQTAGLSLLTHRLVPAPGSGGSQLHFDPVYSHLDRSNCQWQFSAWFSVHTLLSSCGAHRQTDSLLNVTVISTYWHFGAEGPIAVGGNQTTVTMSPVTSSSPQYLPPPLHILPRNSTGPLPYLFPLSIEQGGEGGDGAEVVLCLVTDPDQQLLASDPSLHLLHVSTTLTSTTQVWRLQLERLETGGKVLQFGENCTGCGPQYLFRLPLEPALDDEIQLPTLRLDMDTVLSDFKRDRVSLRVRLVSEQVLEAGESLAVQDMYLCEQVGQSKCSSRHSLMGVAGYDRFDVHVEVVSGNISVDFSTQGINILSDSSTLWFLHIELDLSNTSGLYQSTSIFPITLPPKPTPTTSPTDDPVIHPPSPFTEEAPFKTLYGVIGFLAVVVVLLLVLSVVIFCLTCTKHGKSRFYQKAAMLRKESEKELVDKLNSVRGGGGMKRTHSTTCFPTQDHRLKDSRKGPVKFGRTQGRGKPTLPKRLSRSQSLPSIFHSPSDLSRSLPPFLCHEPAVVRKINRHGVRVHFKRDNVESSAINKWNSQQLQRNRELANLHIVQDLAIRYKNYGVNEIQPGQPASGPRGSGRTSAPYAKYVVTTLAASAKTPEPGAKPVTKL